LKQLRSFLGLASYYRRMIKNFSKVANLLFALTRKDVTYVQPIAYAIRTLQKHECNYGVTELEALGVVWAVKHFRSYLYGHRCDVYTDHEALKSLFNTSQPSGRLARWGMALQELDLHLHYYRPGRANSDADALSQNALPDSCDNSDILWKVLAAINVDDQPAKVGENP